MTTHDPNDPRLTHGADTEPTDQAEVYLVRPDTHVYVRPIRRAYTHNVCGGTTTMSLDLATTYAMDPTFYGATYCVTCRMHRPVSEFHWYGTDEVVGS